MASLAKKRKLSGTSNTPQLSAFAARTLRIEVEERATEDVEQNSQLDDPIEENDSFNQSRADSPEVLLEQPAIKLSSIERDYIKVLDDGTLSIELAPGKRLVLLGEGEVSVLSGQVTIMGATLRRKTRFRFCAPSSHSLPVIRCLETEMKSAKIQLHQSDSGLASLSSLSPLFGKMWNECANPLGDNEKDNSLIWKDERSTFQILFSSNDGPPKAFLQPIISAPEWNKVLSQFKHEKGRKAPAIMICGPKASGKSTFAKILANKLLSGSSDQSSASSAGVALLDLDPGQPEYSIPGQLSLVHLQEPNFGPPFSHPWPSPKNRLVRAHTLGAITPAEDPYLYMKCALDLFAHYRILLSQYPDCCLVINTPGWVLGTGLEILVDLITKVRPTDIIYMSQEGPWDVINRLREAAKTVPVHTLPSQTCQYTTRTAAHLRTMQAMSYFHMSNERLSWDSSPLTSVPPWEIKYAGERAGIYGILPYGEQPSPEHLLDSINGSIVAVVVIDDAEAIPGMKETAEDATGAESEQLTRDDTANVHLPHIISTPDSELPYFNPRNSFTLDPQYSHCIGLALIRSIDIPRRRLQILTPITPDLVEGGKRIVLVSGKFDTPGWAYTETTDFESVPWVETLEGSQGRGIGSRVWRVRRDLGRDGGD